MDCVARGVAKSQTRLSNFHFPLISSLPSLVQGPLALVHPPPLLLI